MTPCIHLIRVHQYHDGELSASDAVLLKAHLHDCPQCQRELTDLQQFSTQFREFTPAMPVNLVSSITQRINSESDTQTLKLVRWLAMAAAIVLCVSLVQLSQTSDTATNLSSPSPWTWETAAVQLVADSQAGPGANPGTIPGAITDEQRIAQWMVQDLSSRSNGRNADASGSKLHE